MEKNFISALQETDFLEHEKCKRRCSYCFSSPNQTHTHQQRHTTAVCVSRKLHICCEIFLFYAEIDNQHFILISNQINFTGNKKGKAMKPRFKKPTTHICQICELQAVFSSVMK